jgi:hypothetical protein
MLRQRREARKKETGSPGRQLGFTIYGPENEELSKWTSRDDEEYPA